MEKISRLSKQERVMAMQSYDALTASLERIDNNQNPEIEIEETEEKIQIPIGALKLLRQILKSMSEGKTVSIVPIDTEVTTQKAAEILGCSRPFIVKLLEEGKIPFTKVGRHRRIQLEDLLQYKRKMKQIQKQAIIELMQEDEEAGLYDS